MSIFHGTSPPIAAMALVVVLLITAASDALPRSLAPRLKFEEINIEDGLSQSIVECIIQDRKGFIWLGTESGLNKFDGYDFEIIVHDPGDPNSLSYNHILSICEDREGYIWVGTFHGGLNRYDPDTGDFKRYSTDPDDPSSISHNYISVITEDRSGVLWVGTGNGLNRYDRETDGFTRFLFDPRSPTDMGSSLILEIYADKTGFLWIGQDGGGLLKMDRSGNIIHRYRNDPDDPGTISGDHVRAVIEDPSGFLWAGTVGGGLNYLDPFTGTFENYRHDPRDPGSLNHDQVYALYIDPSGSLWIGTNGGGLDFFDVSSGRFVHYVNDPSDQTSISYNEIYDIFEDRSGVVWVGTYGGGANKFDRKRKRFDLYRPDPGQPDGMSGDIVWTLFEKDGILWFGTHGGGLNRLDRSTGLYTHYRHDPEDPFSISSDIVRVIYVDLSGTFWVGTHGGGISRFDPDTGRFYSHTHAPDDPTTISHNEIRSIYEDRAGVLWVGTYGGGLNRFDRDTGIFTTYRNDPDDPSTISNDFIRVMHEDGDGDFWIGTQGGGLELFDRENGTFEHFRADPSDPGSLSNDYVFAIHEDRNGVMWIGTMGGGLNAFDRSTGKFRIYTEEDGLSDNSVYGILVDDRERLWLSTNFGLSMFDPRTGTFKNYTDADGLQSNEFNGGAFFKNEQGELFFGGINGFNSFIPREIMDNTFVPPIVLTSFTKLNEPADLGIPLSEVSEIVLSHRDYVFSFQFSALDFTAPAKNRYAYMMDGLDSDWIYTGADKRFATYTTLAPGDYTFRVKGSNNDGVWNETGIAIDITITPPFYKRTWFRLLAGIIVLGTAVFFYLYRMRDVRIIAELKAAHSAQMSIMPHSDPVVEGFDISGTCIPAYEVGGDFYDYIWMDEEKRRFAVAVGDVSGKAMKAAMIAVMSSGMISSRACKMSSIEQMMTDLNLPMHSKTDPNMYTTLLLAAFDTVTKEMVFVNAGFSDPILKSKGNVGLVKNAGSRLPLGLLQDSKYTERKISLEPGDILIFYSDGVSDAKNRHHEYYETESLEIFLKNTATEGLSAGKIKDLIIADVTGFAGSTPQTDDITVVVVKVI